MKNKLLPRYDYPEMNNFRELMEYDIKEHKDNTAARWLTGKTEHNVKYSEFYDDVKALGTYFLECGFNRTHIALIGENSYMWVVAYLAAVNTNNVIVPIDKELPSEDIAKLVKKSDSTVLVFSDAYKEEVSAIDCEKLINIKDLPELINEGKELVAKGNDTYDKVVLDNDVCCTIIFTSGTTGDPKGVMLSHRNIVRNLIQAGSLGIPQFTTMVILPLHHAFGFSVGIGLPMLLGSPFFINQSTRNLLSDMKYARPQLVAMVPLIADIICKKIMESAEKTGKAKALKTLMKTSDFLLDKLHIDLRRKLFANVLESFGGEICFVSIAGASVNRESVRMLHSLGIDPYVGYGASECSPMITGFLVGNFSPDSDGYLVPDMEIRFVNDEIQLKGPNVFLGYYKDEKATADAFDDGWYKTGDLGEMKDGYLYIKGRCKNLIILSNGKNVSPEELETLLMTKVSEITEIIVYGSNDAINAEIFLENNSAENQAAVENKISEINRTLPIYKQISKVHFRDKEFEKNTSKKIKRIAKED